MNPLIQLKTTPPLLITLALLCFGLLPRAQAVVPPPDGGYPGFNTAEGQNALFSLTTGFANTALGSYALFANTTGAQNTAVGAGALDLNTVGNNNTAVGIAALLLNTTGADNTAVGTAALENNTAGRNTANGTFALFTNTEGGSNTAIGDRALVSNTSGNNNTALGANAGFNTTGNNNIDIGNSGVGGESSMIRIGDLAVHTGIFLAGITAMSPEAPNQALLVDPTTGQLGSADVTPEYAIVTVFVDRGNGPSRWAFYSAPLGSPAGTTTGGVFRFSCSAAQAPCKISYGAAVVSNQSTANATIHPRLLINKNTSTFCENADGANNNAGLAQIPRVPTLADAVIAMQTPLTMGIGGTLDCGSGQPFPPDGVATEIWVPEGFYDVWGTFAFGLTLELPPPVPGE
jgi:hypothetical protein